MAPRGRPSNNPLGRPAIVERALAERAIGFYETWEEEKFNPVTGRFVTWPRCGCTAGGFCLDYRDQWN